MKIFCAKILGYAVRDVRYNKRGKARAEKFGRDKAITAYGVIFTSVNFR